MNKCYCNWTFI